MLYVFVYVKSIVIWQVKWRIFFAFENISAVRIYDVCFYFMSPKKMRTEIKKHYLHNKNIWKIGAGIVVVIVFFWMIQGNSWWRISYDDLSFAGEVMPTEGKYQLNIERFDRELALLQMNPAQFVMIYKRWNLIVPMIEKELKKAGLPDDLKYIPVIESALRENVVSSAGAAGIWQFMPDTARGHGLIVDEFVDERFDVAKSTAAAMKHLAIVYSRFSNRTLAAAAYNRWQNGLATTITNQLSDNYYDLWLNNETSRYVFRLLTMKYVWEHRYEFFDRDQLGEMYSSFKTEDINLKQTDNLADRAKNNGYSYYEVKKLNPWILKNSLPEGQWNVQVFK